MCLEDDDVICCWYIVGNASESSPLLDECTQYLVGERGE